MNRLLPYPTLLGRVELEVVTARLDGKPLDGRLVSPERHVIALNEAERPQWEEARIEVRLRTPRELRTGTWPEASCVAVLSERLTNTRSVTRLSRESDDSWLGTVELHRDRHREQVTLDAHVVASVQEIPGRVVGSAADVWVIDLQARTPARRNEISYVETDFSAPENAFLHPFKDDPWTVQASGAEPMLYVNAGFEGLYHLLHQGDRAIGATIAGQMLADLWTALFNSAASGVEIGEDEQGVWPGGWRESVLRRLIPDVFPEHSPNDALLEIASRRSQREEGDLQTRLLHAATKQARAAKSLSGLIKAMAKKEKA